MVRMETWREILVGPRWAKLPSFIRDECFRRGLDLTIDVEKGWIRESARIEVKGDKANLDGFKSDLYAAMDNYNRKLSGEGT